MSAGGTDLERQIEALRRESIGRTVVEHDVATAAPMRGLVVTFDRDETPPGPGEAIPLGWHWAYFLPMARRATLGADGLPTETGVLPKVPLPRRPSGDLFRLPGNLRRAVAAADAAIADSRADVVVGFGGYVSTPAYLAARRRGIPVVVHEQNARPGVANRLGARFARHVAVTFPGNAVFKAAKKTVSYKIR